ncbi:EamA/RhaT family transporter [Ktedonosporobacter rubrisoli]|uniref:EamA/RhaT family transporter n=1 Tax=Ktedonosporobacter rubrisoli TaxID=2509675 RepID=A0A4P6JJQ1_KTERU|nr:EamA family transporter [Ktedonosporobacter rubrisoli]QBD75355.1 EamA/RhaT family transporter [Ktedonosporobacter rubrisoli]
MRTKEIGVLLLLSAIWGGGFLFIRIGTPVLGPVALMAARVVLAGLSLLVFALLTGTRLELRTYWRHYLVVGIINAAIPFTLIGVAELYLTSGLAALLNATTPLFGVLVSVIWIKEAMTLKKAIGLILGLLGVVILAGWSTLPFSTMLVFAILASLAAAASYGIASVYIKVHLGNKVSSLSIATCSQLAAILFLVPLTLVAPPKHMPSLSVLLAVVALALFCTSVTLLLYIWLIAHAGPTKTLTVTFLAPIFGVFWGVLFLHEPLTFTPFVGLVIILLGAGLVTELLFRSRAGGAAQVSAEQNEENVATQVKGQQAAAECLD